MVAVTSGGLLNSSGVSCLYQASDYSYDPLTIPSSLTTRSKVSSFTGNAFQLNGDGNISAIIGVNVHFRAGYWDGNKWPCE